MLSSTVAVDKTSIQMYYRKGKFLNLFLLINILKYSFALVQK